MTDQLERLDQRLAAAVPPPSRVNLDAAWGRLRRRMDEPPRRRRVAWLIPVAAATALVLLLMGRPWEPRNVELATGAGERRVATLSDGSSVVLAPGTTIRHRPNLGNPRVVELTGEAWFEVAADSIRPFVVITSAHEVRVVGTSFGVRADQNADSVTVTVATGRVALRPRGGDGQRTLLLTEGQAGLARGDAAPVRLSPADAARLGAWYRGELRFDATPLAAVVRELERRFALQITLSDTILGQRPVTGTLSLDSVERALAALALTLDLDLVRRGPHVELRSR